MTYTLRIYRISAAALLGLSLLAGCSNEPNETRAATSSKPQAKAAAAAPEPAAKTTSKDAASRPSKETFVVAARAFATALDKKEYPVAVKMMVAPKGMAPDRLEKGLAKLAKQEGITLAQMNKLIEQGKYYKVTDMPKPGSVVRRAKRNGLDPEQCFGMQMEGSRSELFGYWDGKSFKFFRVNNLHRIE